MDPNRIRSAYLAYFKERGHAVIPSSSLVPENDPTTLFTGSGMQPLVPYLLGKAHPAGARLVNAQKCFRSGDIEEVGDNRHTTFFEMLGNWSLGEYGKREQLTWFFHFLVDVLGLDPQRMFVTVFAGDEALGIPRDTEAVEVWQELFRSVGINAESAYMGSEAEGAVRGMRGSERIFYYDAKKNWWSRAGVPSAMPTGEPGGPDSEVFYRFHTAHTASFGDQCHPNCDCGQFLEIGNSVFMQYRKEADGSFSLLPKANVDFGGGLERLVMASTGISDIVRVNHAPIISLIEQLTGATYGSDSKNTKAFRVIADHLKAAVFLIADGVVPSNTDQGYFVRRLLRRAVRFADGLGLHESGLAEVVSAVCAMYEGQYPYVRAKESDVRTIIAEEERKFRATLARGLREFEKRSVRMSVPVACADSTRVSDERGAVTYMEGKIAFDLYQTYGFPLELIIEEASALGMVVDMQGFESEKLKHQELSRAGSEQKFKGGLADHGEVTTMLHTCTHLLLAGLQQYLGPGVHQAGSNITAERIRFDFTHADKVPREVLDQVETYVNEALRSDAVVLTTIMQKDEARAAGVEGSFWDKYPDQVSVYEVRGSDGTVYSRELCGGPHVASTVNIVGTFHIVKEESSSAGVRRIKAVLR